MLYVMTMFSFLAIIYIIFGMILNVPSVADEKVMSLAGNIVVDLEDSFEVGQNISGNIILTEEEVSYYGFVLLTKRNEAIATETFNLEDIPRERVNSGYSINIEDLIDYEFEEKGKYELFFSVLDLDINIRKEFVVK